MYSQFLPRLDLQCQPQQANKRFQAGFSKKGLVILCSLCSLFPVICSVNGDSRLGDHISEVNEKKPLENGTTPSCVKTNGEGRLLFQDLEHVDSSEQRPSTRQFPVTKFLNQLLGTRLFNTTMNFIVPGFHVVLPTHTEEGGVDHLAMQAFFGLFWAIAWISTIAIPTIVTYFQPLGIARSNHDRQESFHQRWKLNDRLADAIGLNWDSCLEKSVCQAYRNPEKYGALGATMRLLFPRSKSEYHQLDDGFAAAAQCPGEKGGCNNDCNQLARCFFDGLDVLLYMKNYCYAMF